MKNRNVDEAIIDALATKKEQNAGELYKNTRKFNSCYSEAFYNHLKKLIEQKFVRSKRDGKKIIYFLNPDELEIIDLLFTNISVHENDTKQMINNAKKFSKKLQLLHEGKTKFLKEDRHLIALPALYIGTLLDNLKIISIILASNVVPKKNKHLIRLQKLHNDTLKEIFRLIKYKKMSLSILI